MTAIREFLHRVRKTGKKTAGNVTTVAMGRERVFEAWNVGEDTFIFELGLRNHLDEHPSVLIVRKCDLGKKTEGFVMTMTTGNHSVAALPLLDGRFWKFSRIPSSKRGEVLMHDILCANVVQGKIEISQRDVQSRKLYEIDDWLIGKAGFSIADIIMSERNSATLEHYHELGQEWRVKPLAWTENEMRVSLSASQKRIASKLLYYHSAKGVHFLSFPEFEKFTALASSNPEEYIRCLRELVSVYDGNFHSFTRMPKYRGHHEIELFGLPRGIGIEKIIPELEKLMEAVVLERISIEKELPAKAEAILSLYRSLLSRPELADSTSKTFTEMLYMYITGEVYMIASEGATPAFDDRRTALPGADFVDGRPSFHPGCDSRSEVLLSNLRALMSKDEVVEYANVYEIREDETTPIGKGRTREIIYKTNRGPLETGMIEKRLARTAKGYASYMLARIGVFKALGISLSDFYRMLRRRGHFGSRAVDYYIRSRCSGEPMDAIPENYFRSADDFSVEEKRVVLALATLMGDAAAQNMAMKKFDPKENSPLFGVGKEIYEFDYDFAHSRVMPKRVATCSIRGSFGWPDLSLTDENLHRMANFYLSHFAHALKIYQRKHNVTMKEVAERFMDGFEFRTHSLSWQLSVMRDKFESFQPDLPSSYNFAKKWRFVMWSLDRQERRLEILKRMFYKKVEIEEKTFVDDSKEVPPNGIY